MPGTSKPNFKNSLQLPFILLLHVSLLFLIFLLSLFRSNLYQNLQAKLLFTIRTGLLVSIGVDSCLDQCLKYYDPDIQIADKIQWDRFLYRFMLDA